MRIIVTPLILLTSAVILSGCGGGATVSENQCIASDWQTLGYRDGVNGIRSSQLLKHQDACVEHGIIPDRAGYMAGNYMAGRFGDRMTGDFLGVSGSFGSVLGAGLLVGMTLIFGLSTYGLFLPFAVMSLAQGLAMPHAQAAAIAQEPALTGTASGIVVFLQFLFIAIFPQILSAWSDGTANPMMIMVSALAILSLVCGLGAVRMSRRG